MSATCLGFDYGLKRIGVAVGEPLLGSARPLATVANDCGTPDWAGIDALIDTWRPALLVVGLPLTADGGEQELTRQARGFMKRLARRPSLPAGASVVACDERFSSVEAGARLAGARADGRLGRRLRREDIDGEAAAIILERWFARDAGSPAATEPSPSETPRAAGP